MHLIDGPGATIDNEFTGGDPQTGTPATVVTADWLNDIQGEFKEVIEAAGLTLTKGQRDQLLNSILLKIGGTLTGDLLIQKNAAPTLTVEALDNASFGYVVAKSKEAGGTVIEVRMWAATLSGGVGTITDHPLFFYSNNLPRYQLTSAGVLQTNAGDLVHDDSNTPRVKSLPLNIVFDSEIVVPHPLGVIPSKVWAALECVTAEGNYAIGNRVFEWNNLNAASAPEQSYTFKADETNISLTMRDSIEILDFTAQTLFALNPANWRVIVMADP